MPFHALAIALLSLGHPEAACPTADQIATQMREPPNPWPARIVEGKEAERMLDAINATGEPTHYTAKTLIIGNAAKMRGVAVVLFDKCPKGIMMISEDAFRDVLRKSGGEPL